MAQSVDTFKSADLSRDRDRFLRELLRELSGVLEETIGLTEVEGFIAIVGNRIGELLNEEYLEIADVDRLNVRQVADALVDLKRRIQGGFTIESLDEEKIVLTNTACPFGDCVRGRKSLCMMTSNVFGRITANNLGYARVDLPETIAGGDSGCRAIVYLNEGGAGREYYG
jgi:hypothetical protein